MTERERVLKSIKMAEHQLLKAIAGLDAETAETRTNAHSMTIREQIVHLGECCVAVLAAYEGREYNDWGTWLPEDRSWSGVKQAWRKIRAEAVAGVPEEGKGLDEAFAFLAAHDFYHVGQIAAARRVAHPEWDTYAIYGEPTVTDDGL